MEEHARSSRRSSRKIDETPRGSVRDGCNRLCVQENKALWCIFFRQQTFISDTEIRGYSILIVSFLFTNGVRRLVSAGFAIGPYRSVRPAILRLFDRTLRLFRGRFDETTMKFLYRKYYRIAIARQPRACLRSRAASRSIPSLHGAQLTLQ